MRITQVENKDHSFSYIVECEASKTAVVVDVAVESHQVKNYLEKHNLKLKYLILTSSDRELISSIPLIKQDYPEAELVMHIDTDYKPDIQLEDDSTIEFGSVTLKCIHTPGHTKDSVCLLANHDSLLTGQTLLIGNVGSSEEGAEELQYDSLLRLKKVIDPKVIVWPGSRTGRKTSNIFADELETNPFLMCKDFGRFNYLKHNWKPDY